MMLLRRGLFRRLMGDPQARLKDLLKDLMKSPLPLRPSKSTTLAAIGA
jgi:hypothetical protein